MNALRAYKDALRATRVAFKGDSAVLVASRAKIREGFLQNRELQGEQAEEELKKLEEVSKFLVKNIVQGEFKDDGRYHLKFHEKTELGDNETIKQSNKANLGSLAGAKTTVRKCSTK